MSWAADHQSAKVEDRAYSLLGIVDVAMVVNYGEGDRSFQRLQDELLRTTSDDSIFAFHDVEETVTIAEYKATNLLAKSPRAFRECADVSIA